jgi:carboxyl-terminal processing protease
VYTEGSNTPKREYRARKEGVFEQGKLAVLVDELTASASEILAGALQDWDRAEIVGRRSFGKGLVQEQYELSDGSALRLTVARYYTPLGRSIQRPYDKGKKIYMDELYDRYQNGELMYADSIHFNGQKAFKTSRGKTVYAGGGIMPDVFVPIDSSLLIHSVTNLYLDGRFNNFVYQYYTQHLPEWQQYKTPAEFSARYNNTADAWNGLVAYAARDSINLKKVSADDRKEIQDRIKAYLARIRWRTQGFYQVSNASDKVVIKARNVLEQ